MTTTQTARQPASARVAATLAGRIQSGQSGPDTPLPTERVLAADLGVHRRSVRAAIEQLVQEGLVSHRPNCRPTVEGPRRETLAAATFSGSPRISTSNLIALIMWHGGGPLEHAGTSQQRIFWGMNEVLTKAGCHAVFLDIGGVLRPEAEIAVQEAEHLRYIQDQDFGGAIFYPYAYRHNRALVEEVSRSVPLVLLDRQISGVEVDFVGVENRSSLFEVTQHLIGQGHQRIAYLTGYEPVQSIQDRIAGYLEAMRGENASERTEIILTIPPYRDLRAWAVVDAVFRQPEGQRPTAVVCATDYLAVDVAERLEFLGLSIPQDVALTGFDGIVPTLPKGLGLTTATQPYEEMGKAAAELLLRRRENALLPPKSVEMLAPLVVRASSIPAAEDK